MTLDPVIRSRLTLPAICAPMFAVSGPALVSAACKAGVIGGLPRANARDLGEFQEWMGRIKADLDRYSEESPEARIAPVAVNLSTGMARGELRAHLDICRRCGGDLIISAAGNPTELVKQVHDWGGKVFHDVTSIRHAEVAIAAGADGLTCIGAGGGGQSGTISHLALVPQVRAMFSGTIVLGGAVTSGAAIRAAEILGADLAYLGTRFIATRESDAPDAYKQMLVTQTSAGLLHTPEITGVPASWLIESIVQNGLDPENLPQRPAGGRRHDHLPAGVGPWKTLWSAGHGIDLIHDIPEVAELVARLRREYVEACEMPDMAEAARL